MVSEASHDGVWYQLTVTRYGTKLTIENIHGEKGIKHGREVNMSVDYPSLGILWLLCEKRKTSFWPKKHNPYQKIRKKQDTSPPHGSLGAILSSASKPPAH